MLPPFLLACDQKEVRTGGQFDAQQRERERDEFEVFSWCFSSLSACYVNTDVKLRIQHANAIFAFQRYLRGYMFIFRAAEKEVSQADVNHFKFSIKDTRPRRIRVLMGTL